MENVEENNIKNNIKNGVRIFLITAICILINYLGKIIAVNMELPLWLDSIGTAICAYIYGPVCGAIVGVSVNVVYGVEDCMVFI